MTNLITKKVENPKYVTLPHTNMSLVLSSRLNSFSLSVDERSKPRSIVDMSIKAAASEMTERLPATPSSTVDSYTSDGSSLLWRAVHAGD